MKTGILKNKLVAFVAMIAFGLGLASCNTADEPTSPDVAIDDVTNEAALESAYDDIDGLSTSVVDELSLTSGRTAGDERMRCATVTRDTVARQIIIDFGAGCEGPGGRVRQGIIRVAYTGFRFLPGAVVTTTLEGFAIDGVAVEGTRTLTNITNSIAEPPSFNITIVGGKATWPDGTFATREVNRIKTWFRAANPIDDQWQVEGSTNGMNRNGIPYGTLITSPLVFKRGCAGNRVFVPVQGIKEITRGDNTFVVDFGNGSCDNQATVTKPDGTIETVNLRPNSNS